MTELSITPFGIGGEIYLGKWSYPVEFVLGGATAGSIFYLIGKGVPGIPPVPLMFLAGGLAAVALPYIMVPFFLAPVVPHT